MNYASIRTCDIANGEGVRVSLFVSGCTHHCPGCFNAEAQAFDYGKPFTREVEDEILAALAPDYIAGLTLLGGEPMEPANQRALVPFLRRFRERYGATKTLWVYTGCVLEELNNGTTDGWQDITTGDCHSVTQHSSLITCRFACPETPAFLDMIDVLVDGPFVLALKDISLKFRGSSNQRILRRVG